MKEAPALRPGLFSFREISRRATPGPWLTSRQPSRPRLQVLRIVERLVADCGHFDWVGLAEIFDDQLSAFLAIGPGQVGERDVLADGRAIGDRGGEGAAA